MADNPLFRPARPLLEARGFKKKGPAQVYVRPLSPGINAWLGLNARTGPGRLTLTPTVGVRHEHAQRWTTRLRDRDPKHDTAPTVQTGMMLLLPGDRHYPHWVLHRDQDDDNDVTWDRFRRDLDEYVVPWWEARSTGEAIVAALRRGEGIDTGRLALPVLLWILGDEQAAREAVEQGRHLIIRGGLVVNYDAYAERLLAEIDTHPTGPA
jgi:hypothetical protein